MGEGEKQIGDDPQNLSAIGQVEGEVWGGRMAFSLGNADLRSQGIPPGACNSPFLLFPLLPRLPSLWIFLRLTAYTYVQGVA